jgi:hypothetical protein
VRLFMCLDLPPCLRNNRLNNVDSCSFYPVHSYNGSSSFSIAWVGGSTPDLLSTADARCPLYLFCKSSNISTFGCILLVKASNTPRCLVCDSIYCHPLDRLSYRAALQGLSSSDLLHTDQYLIRSARRLIFHIF